MGDLEKENNQPKCRDCGCPLKVARYKSTLIYVCKNPDCMGAFIIAEVENERTGRSEQPNLEA